MSNGLVFPFPPIDSRWIDEAWDAGAETTAGGVATRGVGHARGGVLNDTTQANVQLLTNVGTNGGVLSIENGRAFLNLGGGGVSGNGIACASRGCGLPMLASGVPLGNFNLEPFRIYRVCSLMRWTAATGTTDDNGFSMVLESTRLMSNFDGALGANVSLGFGLMVGPSGPELVVNFDASTSTQVVRTPLTYPVLPTVMHWAEWRIYSATPADDGVAELWINGELLVTLLAGTGFPTYVNTGERSTKYRPVWTVRSAASPNLRMYAVRVIQGGPFVGAFDF